MISDYGFRRAPPPPTLFEWSCFARANNLGVTERSVSATAIIMMIVGAVTIAVVVITFFHFLFLVLLFLSTFSSRFFSPSFTPRTLSGLLPDAVVCEPRYVIDIVRGARADGLAVA